MEFSQGQIYFLRISIIVYSIIIFFSVLFILHNIYRYVIGLKMKRPLIWMFYIFLLVANIMNLTDYAYQIADKKIWTD